MQITNYTCDITNCDQETEDRDSMRNFTGNFSIFNSNNGASLVLNGNEICPHCVSEVNDCYRELGPFLVNDGLGNLSISPRYSLIFPVCKGGVKDD